MKPLSKKAALALVYSGITFGQLRRSIEAGRSRVGTSRLNKALTVEQAADIFTKSLSSKPNDDEKVEATRWSPTRDRHVASTWAIIATNILREFGAPPT